MKVKFQFTSLLIHNVNKEKKTEKQNKKTKTHTHTHTKTTTTTTTKTWLWCRLIQPAWMWECVSCILAFSVEKVKGKLITHAEFKHGLNFNIMKWLMPGGATCIQRWISCSSTKTRKKGRFSRRGKCRAARV